MLSPSNQSSLESIALSRDFHFPTNPYIAHSEREGLSFDEIVKQKQSNTKYVSDFVATLPLGLDQKLGFIGIELMQECHFNQFREGVPQRHYTHHTSYVGVRAAQAAVQYLDTLNAAPSENVTWITDRGDRISAVTIVLLLGLLHDSREDFWCNFQNTPQSISRNDGALLVDHHILTTLTPLLGEACAWEVIKRITWLSIENQDEFPTERYVDTIMNDFFCSCVKRADYSHNLKTFPDFTPTYPLLMVPAQYGRLMDDSLFRNEYLEGLLLNLAQFDPAEIVPWDMELRKGKIRTSDYIIGMFEKYKETQATARIRLFFSSLNEAIENGEIAQLLSINNLNKSDISSKIQSVLDTVSGCEGGALHIKGHIT